MIELLNNRASTQAKGQRYDTMLEQLQVRKAEIQSRLLTSQSEAGSVQENLQSYEQELKEISDKIIELTESNQANEDEIAEIQKEMQGNPKNCVIARLHITGTDPDWNLCAISQNAMTDMAIVSVRLWSAATENRVFLVS